jgi:hypothetical protein
MDMDYNRFVHGHSTGGNGIGGLGALPLLLLKTGKPELANRKQIGFEALAD